MLTATIVGHLGKDAVINETNGRKVINFSVAHTEKYKDATGTMCTKTIWVECAKWGDATAVAAYLKKGTLVAVNGRPEVQAYKKQDGSPGASLRCQVLNIELLSSNSNTTPVTGGEMPVGTPAHSAPNTSTAAPEDDLPF